jgi:hypothetical protein
MAECVRVEITFPQRTVSQFFEIIDVKYAEGHPVYVHVREHFPEDESHKEHGGFHHPKIPQEILTEITRNPEKYPGYE